MFFHILNLIDIFSTLIVQIIRIHCDVSILLHIVCWSCHSTFLLLRWPSPSLPQHPSLCLKVLPNFFGLLPHTIPILIPFHAFIDWLLFPSMNEDVWYFSSCVWLVSLVAASDKISLFFTADRVPLCKYNKFSLSIFPLKGIKIAFVFWILWIVLQQTWGHMCHFGRKMSSPLDVDSRIAGSYVSSVSGFWRTLCYFP